IWAGSVDPEALHPGVVPLTAPELPLWPAVAVLVGLLPALVAPVPPTARGAASVPPTPRGRGFEEHDRSGKEQA
ncbi:energy-coupling factor transporter transmembrane protein EcfT, partial [Streptomyces sp. DSM 41640]|nr:energy-coupling factor transporter transmembrane protein EcfT [Streptomyces sp. DSM 41640]